MVMYPAYVQYLTQIHNLKERIPGQTRDRIYPSRQVLYLDTPEETNSVSKTIIDSLFDKDQIKQTAPVVTTYLFELQEGDYPIQSGKLKRFVDKPKIRVHRLSLLMISCPDNDPNNPCIDNLLDPYHELYTAAAMFVNNSPDQPKNSHLTMKTMKFENLILSSKNNDKEPFGFSSHDLEEELSIIKIRWLAHHTLPDFERIQ